MNIIDRRLNPKGKSLGNRQRFVRRAKMEIREAVRDALKERKVSSVEGSEKITIRSKSVRESSFHFDRRGGRREYVLPGNKEYVPGDRIPRPPSGGGSGRDGSPDGDGQDDFVFTLTKDEFLNIFFEDLELPDLVKRKITDEKAPQPARAGYTVAGSPSNLNVSQTMRNSLTRRIALKRPRGSEVLRLERELAELERREQLDEEDAERLDTVRAELAGLLERTRRVAYIDPLDLRFNRFEQTPRPTTQAVMFCLMDASASMTEVMKDIAKRFFMLLHVFLTRRYRNVEVVFIRHTSSAQEVDEDTFFHSTETGGTVVSTALDEMNRVIRERFPLGEWNIYAAQASDGDNFRGDMPACLDLLESSVFPMCQYFAYIEVGERRPDIGFVGNSSDSPLWRGYATLTGRHKNFAMRRVASAPDIFPVFHELFSKNQRGQ